MQIDAFTLVAQLVNFAILVLLLQRFLYRPVRAVMARREAQIRERLRQADEQQRSAEQTAADYREKNARFDAAAGERRAALDEQLAGERTAALDAVRDEADRARDEWHKMLADEQERRADELRRQLGAGACRLARGLLTTLADESLEARAVNVFLVQLDALAPAEQQALAADPDGFEVISAFPLDGELRARISAALEQRFGARPAPRFSVRPALICGVELSGAQRRVGWNADALASGTERELAALLDVSGPR